MPRPFDPDPDLPEVPFLLGDQVSIPWTARDGTTYTLDAWIIQVEPEQLGAHRVLLVGHLFVPD